MTRLSFDVPAVIGRWKQRNVRRLRSVWWIFATYVLGAAWRRSAPLQTKRAELVQVASTCWLAQAVALCVGERGAHFSAPRIWKAPRSAHATSGAFALPLSGSPVVATFADGAKPMNELLQ